MTPAVRPDRSAAANVGLEPAVAPALRWVGTHGGSGATGAYGEAAVPSTELLP